MEKQYAPSAKEKKMTKTAKAPEAKAPVKVEEKIENKTEEKKEETETKVEEKKVETKKENKTLKDKAFVNAYTMQISSKHSYCICDMIRGKDIDKAIEMLEEVLIFKRAVPMNGMEIPHRHGMMSGRYPKNASKEFILLLKQLKANASVNEIDNAVITSAIANRGSRHFRRGGTRSKSTHVYLEVKDKTKLGKGKLNFKKPQVS